MQTATDWLKTYLRTYSWRFLAIIALGTLTAFAAGALMFTSGYLISKAALRPENILMIYVPIVGVRTFGISRSVLHYVERLVSHDTILRVLSHMRVKLYAVLEPQALLIRSRFRTGDLLGVLAEDIERLQNIYIRTIFPSAVALVMYAIIILALGRFDWLFALLMAGYIAVLVFILPLLSLYILRRQNRKLKTERNQLYQKLTDAVLGLGDWVVSGRAKEFVQAYEQAEQQTACIQRSLSNWTKWRNFSSQFIIALAVISMLIWAGSAYAGQRIDVTLIAAFVLVVLSLADVFLPVAEAVQNIPQYQDSFERLDALEQPTHEKSQAFALNLTDTCPAIIQLSDVSYRYPNSEHNALKDVNLNIPQGKKIAIIGKSGAGKSTLLQIIQGAIFADHGCVLINGHEPTAYGEQIARVISVLNQRPHLFDTTVAGNIRLGKRGASLEELQQVIEQVQLDELIAALPSGLQTPMHETGQRFSGGERQRIALARILLQDTPVVILDEPTVGLDPRTERKLLETIFQTLHGKTLIWVTHHLIGVEHMDEVIFMDQGRIEMRGTHAELLANSPRYQKLYALDRPARLLDAGPKA